jgi:hypothetical protein
MITIRKAQMDVFNDYVRKTFESFSILYLKNKYPVETINMNQDEMLKFVRQGIDKAADYDILVRNDVLPFLEYMICFGNDFDTNSSYEWATDVFRISNLPGDEIIIRLMENQPLTSAIE